MRTSWRWYRETLDGVALFARRHVDLCRVTTTTCQPGMRHR
jgi:hypothetical protein